MLMLLRWMVSLKLIRVRVGVRVRVRFAFWVSVVQSTCMQLLSACGERGLGLGLGNCNCLTRMRLLCQNERGLKKRRESKRSWASEEGGKLGPRGGGTAGAGGTAEGERMVRVRV